MKISQRNFDNASNIVSLAMKANAAALFWFLLWAILPLLKRNKYDQTGESLFWKQSRIRGN